MIVILSFKQQFKHGMSHLSFQKSKVVTKCMPVLPVFLHHYTASITWYTFGELFRKPSVEEYWGTPISHSKAKRGEKERERGGCGG